MELNSGISMTGKLSIKHYDLNGKLVNDLTVPNLVVTAGKEFIANRMTSNDMSPMSYMAIGTSSTPSTALQTALGTEAQRVALSTKVLAGTSVTFTGNFPTTSSLIQMTEAGIFNQSSTNTRTFNGSTALASSIITSVAHGFSTGNEVRYGAGGGTVIGGLSDGGIYYIIRLSADTIKLATTSANASAGTAITLTAGAGTSHSLAYGTMLCRTTFPVVTKAANTDTVVISWTITVG